MERLKNYSILFAEDNKDLRNYLIKVLKLYFKNVYEASNGEEAYKIFTNKPPDIILSDIRMPKLNGIELVKKIRERDAITPIIMLTSYRSEEYLFDLINLNINSYLLKPIDIMKLLESITNIFFPTTNKLIKLNPNLLLNSDDCSLRFNNKKISLRKREREFLLLLYKNKDSTTTYEQIEYTLWEDKIMTTSALKTFIKELRAKIPLDLIQNIQKVGYKFYDLI